MPAPHGEEVVVPLGPRSYPVLVGEEMLPVVGPRLAAAGFHGRCGLVTSERVGRLYGETTASALRASGFEPTVVEIPDGEEHKNLAWLAVIYDRLLEAGIDRRSPVVAAWRCGRALGCCDAPTVARIEHGLTRAGLPTALPSDIAPEALALGMQADKKRTGGRIRFVAVEAIGRVRLVELTPGEIVSRL